MKERLLKVLSDSFSELHNDKCVCPGCVLYYTDANIYIPPSYEEKKIIKIKALEAIKALVELRDAGEISNVINPYLVAMVILEDTLGSNTYLSLKVLQEKAIVLGYAHMLVQYLWYFQNLKDAHPDFTEKRINKILYTKGQFEMMSPIEIGLHSKHIKGYTIFKPVLHNDGFVDIEFEYISPAASLRYY